MAEDNPDKKRFIHDNKLYVILYSLVYLLEMEENKKTN